MYGYADEDIIRLCLPIFCYPLAYVRIANSICPPVIRSWKSASNSCGWADSGCGAIFNRPLVHPSTFHTLLKQVEWNIDLSAHSQISLLQAYSTSLQIQSMNSCPMGYVSNIVQRYVVKRLFSSPSYFDILIEYIYIWVKYIFHLYILLNMLHIWVKYPCLTCFLIIQQWNACWICFSIYRYKIKLFVLRLHLSCYAFKLLKPHIAANWYITIRMDL